MCKLAIFSSSDAKLVMSILISANKRVKPKLIISDRFNAQLQKLAEEHNIKYKYFNYKDYKDRISHEKDIVRFLRKENIDLIIFAHYMRLITKYFVDRFRNKIVNIHPSLLPDFKGAHGYMDAFKAGVKKSGCTLHYVDEGLDTGDIILQKEVHRLKDDSFHSFKRRVHDIECLAIQCFIQGLVV